MKRTLIASIALAGGLLTWTAVTLVRAETEATPSTFEYATIRWEGDDKVGVYLPDRSEPMHPRAQGRVPAKDSHEEEFDLSIAANEMAKEGWEPVSIMADASF